MGGRQDSKPSTSSWSLVLLLSVISIGDLWDAVVTSYNVLFPQVGLERESLTPLLLQPPHQHCLKALQWTLCPADSFLRQTSWWLPALLQQREMSLGIIIPLCVLQSLPALAWHRLPSSVQFCNKISSCLLLYWIRNFWQVLMVPSIWKSFCGQQLVKQLLSF